MNQSSNCIVVEIISLNRIVLIRVYNVFCADDINKYVGDFFP